MSYQDDKNYQELYKKGQDKGKYKIFVFDVIGSREHHYLQGKYNLDKANKFMDSMINLTNDVANKLLNLEMQENKKILHRHIDTNQKVPDNCDETMILIQDQRNKAKVDKVIITDRINPFYGATDLIYFIVERGSINEHKFLKIFKKSMQKFTPDLKFYYKSCYYETDKRSESCNSYYRGYAISQMQDEMKKDGLIINANQEELEM